MFVKQSPYIARAPGLATLLMKQARRPRIRALVSIAVTGGVAGLVAGTWALDRAAASAVARLTPTLERSLSRPLGHPLRLGAYKGLRVWGVAIGPSTVGSSEGDQSSLAAQGLTVRFAPLASLSQWRPVVAVDVERLRLDLHRNDQGQFWRFGSDPDGAEPPNLGVRFRFNQPADVVFADSGERLQVEARGAVGLAERSFTTRARMSWSDRRGALDLDGAGRWDRPQLNLRTRFDGLRLSRLAAVAPFDKDLDLAGELNGDLRLQWTANHLGCRGSFRLNDLSLRSAALDDAVASDRIRLTCHDDTLTVKPTEIRSGALTAQLGGTVTLNQSFDLTASLRRSGAPEGLKLKVHGPWAQPLWTVNGRLDQFVDGPWTDPVALTARLRTPWGVDGLRRVQLERMQLSSVGSKLQLQGQLFPELTLRSRSLVVSPQLWAARPVLRELLGSEASVSGDLQVDGALASPQLALRLRQEVNPVLQRWDLQARWSKTNELLLLERFESPALKAGGTLPLAVTTAGLKPGALQADLALSRYSLDRLSGLAGVELSGVASLQGQINGPLSALSPELSIGVDHPSVAGLRLPERWRGRLKGTADASLSLRMASLAPSVEGQLSAIIRRDGRPSSVQLKRQGGDLSLQGDADLVRWRADQLALLGLQFQAPGSERFEPVVGSLSGTGSLAFAPLVMHGDFSLDGLGYRGVRVAQVQAKALVNTNRFQLDGTLQPVRDQPGDVAVELRGQPGGWLRGGLKARGLDAAWLSDTLRQLRQKDPLAGEPPGRAADLGRLVIDTFGGGLDGQLRALQRSRQALVDDALANPDRGLSVDDLDGRLDADLTVAGPGLDQLNLDLKVKGHLWLTTEDSDRVLQLEPFVASIQGPLRGGEGKFSLEHLPVGLLALFVPVPASLRGAGGVRGRYAFGEAGPQIEAELLFEQVALGETDLSLQRDSLRFDASGLSLDLALKSSGSSHPITLVGTVPLAADDGLDLTIEAHEDALRFLTVLTGPGVEVTRGTTALDLSLRGSRLDPEVSGFLDVQDAAATIQGQELRRINASLLFDFNRLVVNEGSAELAAGGTIKLSGALALLRPAMQEEPLTITITKGRVRQPKADFVADGSLEIRGAITQPELSGELTINQGTIRPREGLLSRSSGGGVQGLMPFPDLDSGIQQSVATVSEPVGLRALMEEQWDFQEPLVLIGPGAPLEASEQLQDLIPNLPTVSFRNFRLRLGPDLRVEMPPMISFRGSGQLLLNGPLDPSLQARGLVRLTNGRVSLFSTTFRLDNSAANVALFTPSLGLVPFVDIAMQTRVSDTVQQGGDSSTTTANVFETNGSGALGPGGQLRLVKVSVQASGPANRLMGNLDLRSTPPMPQPQLLALIGGNSLSGLAGGGGAALATVVGQTLLSPVLGSLTDVMGERLQIALYPTYVNPEVKSESERTSGRVPPTFTLVTEIGIDVNDRFDFSVLSAPNNSDVPPQASISYQVTPNTTVTGSVDSNGTWQSQLQLFFRF